MLFIFQIKRRFLGGKVGMVLCYQKSLKNQQKLLSSKWACAIGIGRKNTAMPDFSDFD